MSIFLSLILAASSAQTTPTITPCVSKVVASEEDAKRLIRRLRRQGFQVAITRGNSPAKIVAAGGAPFPAALAHANTPVSGCGRD